MKSGEILDSLGGFRRRYRLRTLIAAIARWSVWASLLAGVVALGLKIASLPLLPYVLLPLLVPVLAALAAMLHPIPMPRVAREIDRRAQLAERVATAVEWQLAGRGQTLMSRAQHRDALQSLERLSPREVFPVDVPRSTWSLVPFLALTITLVLLPAWHLFGTPPTPVTADLSREAETIEKVARELEKRNQDDAVPLPELTRSAQDLQELAREMRAGQMAEREAMARIADARATIEKTLEQVRREQESHAPGDGKSGKDGAQKDGEKPGGNGQQKASGKDPAKTKPGTAAEREQQKKTREALEKRAQSLEQASRELEAARSQMCQSGAMAGQNGKPGTMAGRGSGMPDAAQGDSQQPTENKGQKVLPGKGKGEADFGKGTTNQDESKGQAIKQKQYVLDRQAAERKQWTVAYEKLYGAERKKRDAANARIKGDRTDQGRTVEMDEEVRGAPQVGGGSQVDERAVYTDSRRRAEEAMAKETVPDPYRDLVRNYFEEINPGDSKKEP